MHRWIFIAIWVINISVGLIAQTSKKDSLLSILNSADSKKKVDIFNQLSALSPNTPQAKEFAFKALENSEKTKYLQGKTIALINIGESYSFERKYDSAVFFLRKAYSSALENGNNFLMGKALLKEAYSLNSLKQVDTALELNKKSYALFMKLNNYYWASMAIRNAGLISKYKGENKEAIKFYEICLALRKRGKDQSDIAESLQDLGTIYYRMGDYDRAVKYYLDVIRINESISNDNGLAGGYANLANIYQVLNKEKEALQLYEKALKIAVKIKKTRLEATILAAMATLNIKEKKYKEASERLRIGIQMKKSINDNSQLPDMLCFYALAKSKLGKTDEALKIYKEAEQLSKDIKDKRGLAIVYGGMSQLSLENKDYSKSIEYGLRALELAEKTKIKSEIADYANVINKSFLSLGNYKEAYRYFKIHRDYADTVLNEKKIGEITRLESKFFYEQKQNEDEKKRQVEVIKEEKKQQRFKFYAVIISSWLLLMVVGALFYNKKLNKKNKIILDQNRNLERLLANLKEAQDQLIQKEKMASLGVLTAGIAHEINNPVNYIMSAVYSYDSFIKEVETAINSVNRINKLSDAGSIKKALSILEKEYDKERVIGNLQIVNDSIKEGISRINRLVGALRNFSRIDKEKKVEMDLHELIDSSLLLMKHRFSDNINVIKEYDLLQNKIFCFPSMLNQVFTNIINNAIDAMEFGGNLIIKTKFHNEENKVKIRIIDGGIGIDSEIKDKIFDPFFTTKDVGKGVGLGLSISYDIIQKHSGEIIFNNCNPGTEVVITLPIS